MRRRGLLGSVDPSRASASPQERDPPPRGPLVRASSRPRPARAAAADPSSCSRAAFPRRSCRARLSLGISIIAWCRCGSSCSPTDLIRLTPLRCEHRFELARGRFDPGEELARHLVGAQLVAHRGERAVEMVLDRQHVAREPSGGIARRLLQLLLQPATHVLGLGGGVERLGFRLLELLLELGDAVVLGDFGRVLRPSPCGSPPLRRAAFRLSVMPSISSALSR